MAARPIGQCAGNPLHITQKLPLDENTLFIITPQEFDLITSNEKLTDIHVERIVPYPDGSPGFYFVQLDYVDNIDEIFAAEKAGRQVLRESIVFIDGQEIELRYSYLDSGSQAESIALVFDNNPYTLAKTFESNPFFLEMTFPAPRRFSGFSIITGSARVQVTLKCFPEPGSQPSVYVFEGQGTEKQPELSFDIPEPTANASSAGGNPRSTRARTSEGACLGIKIAVTQALLDFEQQA
jgi:hypothetical protein